MSFSPKFCIFLLNTIFDIIATLTWFAHMSFLCYKLCRGFYFQILVGFKFQENNMWEGHTSTCIGLVRDFWGTFGCVSCISCMHPGWAGFWDLLKFLLFLSEEQTIFLLGHFPKCTSEDT